MGGKQILAPCGNRCDLCPRFTATEAGSPEELNRVAELWHRAGWRETVVSAEEISCRGCGPESPCRYGIRQCAMSKGVTHCGKCGEYPCVNLLDAFRRSEEYHEKCLLVCGAGELAALRKAFFEKKKNLDPRHR